MTTADIALLRSQLVAHEGIRRRVYKCPAGYWTIGVGRNVQDRDLSMATNTQMLDEDIAECLGDLRGSYSWFSSLDSVRQRALADLRFNLGPRRFRGFKKMLNACASGDWETAAAQLIDSKWATQVQPTRVNALHRQLRLGRD